MKIAIIGSGAIGTLFGGYLARGGNDVTLVTRNPAHARMIEGAGLRVEGVRGKFDVAARATDQAREAAPAELILICVKAYDTAAALAQHAALFEQGGLVLSLQNGIGHAELIEQLVGPDRLLLGTTTVGANLPTAGRVLHNGDGETVIGRPDGQITAAVKQVADVFTRAGLTTTTANDIHRRLWAKLAINAAINAPAAILHMRNGVMANQPPLANLMQSAVRETAEVAAKLGIHLDVEALGAMAVDVARRTATNRCSMLVDVAGGKPTEIDFINGAIAQIGRKQGVRAPVNETLTLLVKAIEQTRTERRIAK